MSRQTKAFLEARLLECEDLLRRAVHFYVENCMYSATNYETAQFPLDEVEEYFGDLPEWNRARKFKGLLAHEGARGGSASEKGEGNAAPS